MAARKHKSRQRIGLPGQSIPSVYFGSDDSFLYRLEPKLKQVWSFRTEGPVETSPARESKASPIRFRLFFGSDDGRVYAVDSEDGSNVWRFPTKGIVRSSPAYSNGVVYVGSDDHNVYAIRAGNGSLLWQFATQAAVRSSPAVGDEVVYVGSDDGYVYALSAGDGSLLWRLQTNGSVQCKLSVTNGMVYATTSVRIRAEIYGIDASSGTAKWKAFYKPAKPSTTHFTDPVVANGLVFVTVNAIRPSSPIDNGGALLGYDAANGRVLHQYKFSPWFYTSPTIADGLVVVGTTGATPDNDGLGRVLSINPVSGVILWDQLIPDQVNTVTAFSYGTRGGGVVYVGAQDNYLYGLDLTTGSMVRKYKSRGPIYSAPAVWY